MSSVGLGESVGGSVGSGESVDSCGGGGSAAGLDESAGSGGGGGFGDDTVAGDSVAEGGTALADGDSSAGSIDSATLPRPALRIVKGNPTTAEVAALVAVFSALGGDSEPEPEPVSAWASPASVHRTGIAVGVPNAWVLSGR